MNQIIADANRWALEQEFITLRNSEHAVIKSYHSKMLRNAYNDYLNDSDSLAKMKTDDELVAAIKRYKEHQDKFK